MKHLLPKFSVPMPGADVNWPFEKPSIPAGLPDTFSCTKCGALLPAKRPHDHAEDTKNQRPRKRVCFG